MPKINKNSLRLFYSLLLPSWLSGVIALIIGLIIFAGPFLLLHFGTTAQEGFLGLHIVYQHSSLTTIAHSVSTQFLGNPHVGQAVFVGFWGAVGLVTYLIGESLVRRAENFFTIVQEFGYVHVARHQLFQYHLVRSAVQILAVIAWCILLSLFIYKILPYSIAAAQLSSEPGATSSNWLTSLAYSAGCILAIHALTVFLRLMVLRPRVFGQSSVVYDE
jgi:hypothetical protein